MKLVRDMDARELIKARQRMGSCGAANGQPHVAARREDGGGLGHLITFVPFTVGRGARTLKLR